MARNQVPSTPATRLLRDRSIPFERFVYTYAPKGGTRAFAEMFNIDESLVIKTLVVEADSEGPLLVLMAGDCEVSLKELARTLGVKRCRMAEPPDAERYTGYRVGGTSPLGTKRPMPIYIEADILDLDRIYVNGGARGFIVGLSPADLASLLDVTPVHVAIRR